MNWRRVAAFIAAVVFICIAVGVTATIVLDRHDASVRHQRCAENPMNRYAPGGC